MTAALVARTVLDLRSPLDKYVSQMLLLAASWHRFAAADARLEVWMIGADRVVTDFLDSIGASHRQIDPGANDHFSRNGNKITATGPDPQGGRVLLLDNDVVFYAGIGELAQLPATAIVAAEAGTARVSNAQWEEMRSTLAMPLLRRRYTMINERPESTDGGEQGAAENFLYLNSGVVLFPAGHDHRDAWTSAQRRTWEHFRDHPLGGTAVTSSDQAGLATSIAEHGDFAWLPIRFNYRPGCFRLGLEPAERIAIVHCTGDVAGSGLTLAQRIDAYWRQYVFTRIDLLSPRVPAGEWRRRRRIAAQMLATTQALVHDYDLESRLQSFRRARSP